MICGLQPQNGHAKMGKMVEVGLLSWSECKVFIADLESAQSQFYPQGKMWFRGQSDSSFKLTTTLDRVSTERVKVSDYYRTLSRVKPAVETMGRRHWPDLDWPKIAEDCRSFDFLSLHQLPAYNLLAHVRHHGFPSPLLDWSHSPFVAAYFAFEHTKSKNVAIYVYSERLSSTKSYSSSEPVVKTSGPYVTTHPRHFRQQASYTTALRFENGEWTFASHEDVFNDRHNELQDQVWKIEMPASERRNVLGELDRYNLNAYSLFGTEDALMTTLSFRNFDQ